MENFNPTSFYKWRNQIAYAREENDIKTHTTYIHYKQNKSKKCSSTAKYPYVTTTKPYSQMSYILNESDRLLACDLQPPDFVL